MPSPQNQLHAIPRVSAESLFNSFPEGKRNAPSPVSVDGKFQQDLPPHGRISPFSASTPGFSPSKGVMHQKVPSFPSTIRVFSHRSGEHTAACLQTLSGLTFGPAFLREGHQFKHGGTVHNSNSEVTSSGTEEGKSLGLVKTSSLSDKLRKNASSSVNSIPECSSNHAPEVDIEGEELTICTKHWSQYTPPESDLPYDNEKMKPHALVPIVEPRSETISMLSIPSSHRKPGSYADTGNTHGDSLSLCHYARSPDYYRGKNGNNPDRKHAKNFVHQFCGRMTSLEQPAASSEKGAMEDSPHRSFTLTSIASERANNNEVSNARESNVSADHSACFMQQYQSPFMRVQSSESSATNATFSRVMPNDGLRSSASIADTIDLPRRISFQQGRMIGSGGFGTVYQAILHDGTLAAVKEIKIEPKNLKLIDREVNVMSSLPQHPNCVRYLGSRNSRHHYYIIMEYISGGSIASLRQSIGPFRESVFQRYAYMVLLGLHHLHSHNIIHRDIKGANVLLDERGCAKIVDFGCCKNLNSGKSTLGGGGTPLWMASEVCRGLNATEKSDVWSFGCLCLEMTNETGLPWSFPPGMTLQGLAYALACAQKPPPIPTTLSPISQDFIACCLRLDPEERWSVSQLLNHDFFNQNYYQHDDEDEDELIVSCNTSAHTSVVKRIVEQVNKGEHAGGIVSETNAGLSVPQPHHSPTHASEGFSNPQNHHFSKGQSTSTRSQLESSLAQADSSVNGFENRKGYDNGSRRPVLSSNYTGENDQRLRTVNVGFRLDVVDDSEDGSEAVKLDMRHKKTDIYIKEAISPSNANETYYAALDDVIELAHHARTEEWRVGMASSLPRFSSSRSSSGSSYLNGMNTSSSDNVEICIPSNTNRTAIPAGGVAQRSKSRRIKKTSDREPTKTVSPVEHTKNSKPADPKLVTQSAVAQPPLKNVSTKIGVSTSTTGKHRGKERDSEDISISSALHDTVTTMSHEDGESKFGKGHQISEAVYNKDNTVPHKPQQEYGMATFVSTPLEPSDGQSFSIGNHPSVNSLQHQQTHRQPTTPGLPTNTSPLSKLVWNTSGSDSISKDASGAIREAHSSGCYTKSSKAQSLTTCENHSTNGELVDPSILQTTKKKKRFSFKWLRNKF